MNEVLILCGNGCGVGAMKIVRGMFETSLLAEHLRRHPEDVSDYVDFGPVLAWRRFQMLALQKRSTVRQKWTTKSMSKLAEDMGRSDDYDMVYGIACSLHHANLEGLTGNFEMKEGRLKMDGPPSFIWTAAALIAAHTYLIFALNTLKECCHLDFDERIAAASKEFESLWTTRHSDEKNG